MIRVLASDGHRPGTGRSRSAWRFPVKKVLLLALVAAGVLAWRRRASDKAERDLWAGATDSIR